MSIGSIIAGFAWDPQIRGFLAVGVGVVVLIGSVYLLLATNVANRLGFLLAATGLMGWMTIMGIVWWVFGIGMIGEAPAWKIVEVSFDTDQAVTEPVRDLPPPDELPDPEQFEDMTPEELEAAYEELEAELNGWRVLPESNPAFGEASATVAADLSTEGANRLAQIGVADESEVVYLYAFETGGKSGLDDDPNRFDRIFRFLKNTFWEVQAPPLYAVLQVQPTVDQEAAPGEPAPTPEADEDQPVVSYVLVRDLGEERLPSAMITLVSGIIFGILVNMLHRRDRRVAEARGLLPAKA